MAQATSELVVARVRRLVAADGSAAPMHSHQPCQAGSILASNAASAVVRRRETMKIGRTSNEHSIGGYCGSPIR
jgi:hypothetical protein